MVQIAETMFADIDTPAIEETAAGQNNVQAYIFDGWSFTPLPEKREDADLNEPSIAA